jgi:hypothetical protein
MNCAGVLVVLGLAFLVMGSAPVAEAGPFQNFFRKVRHAFAHPASSSRHHHTALRQPEGAQPQQRKVEADTGRNLVSGPPQTANTRKAHVLASKHSHMPGLPYGTPVPGKKGLVTSPYAPDSGYVDVRNFPPGTQVKDPYSGKIFLTP